MSRGDVMSVLAAGVLDATRRLLMIADAFFDRNNYRHHAFMFPLHASVTPRLSDGETGLFPGLLVAGGVEPL
jgi:hypothetical protein